MAYSSKEQATGQNINFGTFNSKQLKTTKEVIVSDTVAPLDSEACSMDANGEELWIVWDKTNTGTDLVHIYNSESLTLVKKFDIQETYETSWGTTLKTIYCPKTIKHNPHTKEIYAACAGIITSPAERSDRGLFTIDEDGCVIEVVAKGQFLDVCFKKDAIFGLGIRQTKGTFFTQIQQGKPTLEFNLDRNFTRFCVFESQITLTSDEERIVVWHDMESKVNYTVLEEKMHIQKATSSQPYKITTRLTASQCDQNGMVCFKDENQPKLAFLDRKK